MLDISHKLFPGSFPPINRGQLKTLQVNLGYLCNQSCLHCHVNAGPKRTEIMDAATIEMLLQFIARGGVQTLDLTGGAPELNPHFRTLVSRARSMGVEVIDRCNLTVLEEPGQEGLADFLAENQVQVVASLPCYLEENVDRQRGKGTFGKSIDGLQRLNALGYGTAAELPLNLVYNPQGADLPPGQVGLQADYKKFLTEKWAVSFNQLFVITNMPIKRFGSMLASKGKFDEYIELIKSAHQPENLASVMCLDLISVDWKGYVYDCDFNQMLDLPIPGGGIDGLHISDLDAGWLTRRAIQTGDHCFGCTAGQGSSCGGALG